MRQRKRERGEEREREREIERESIIGGKGVGGNRKDNKRAINA